VLKPIRFQSVRRNEISTEPSASAAGTAMRAGSTQGIGIVVEEVRQQRASTLLVDVAYVAKARFELTAKATVEDTPAKHIAMFNRRPPRGSASTIPALARASSRRFRTGAAGRGAARTLPPHQRDQDLVRMLHGIDHTAGATYRFFRVQLVDGVLDGQACLAEARERSALPSS
jgi:CRISPR-associated protein Cas5d